MKKFLLVLLLLLYSSASAQVMEELSTNDIGQAFIRIHNVTPSYYSCYYRDEVNYVTFVLAPNTVSGWQPVYGYYEWQCT
jgi:hypothetical protein